MTSVKSTGKFAQIEPFVITRIFNVPRELMFKVWTEKKHLQHWWGPKGFVVKHLEIDPRPGSICHYCLKGAHNSEMWGRFLYKEVTPPERIVWINSFSDPQGKVVRPPFTNDWPSEILTTATFKDLRDKTEIRIEMIPYNASDAEIKTFEENRKSMNQGWTGTFEVLEAYILKL